MQRTNTMAALVRHGVFKTGQLLSPKNVFVNSYATKAEKKKGRDRKIGPKIDSAAQSLAARGFLRSYKEYSPPSDVEEKITRIFLNICGSTDPSTKLTDIKKRFAVLTACYNEFQHSIPNSLLHTIETVTDVKEFYLTPVNTTIPLDKLKDMELPKNLHVQYEYYRFHPDTDKLSKGITAFPRSSTLVTGLKYKDKYKGHEQRQTWPFSQ